VVDPALVRRRTAVSGVFGGLAVALLSAGCDPGDDIGSAPPSGSSSPSPSSSVQSPPSQTPDETLVDDVAAQLLDATAGLAQARKFATLRPVVTPLLHAHRAHQRVLEVDGDLRTVSEVPANTADALQQVRHSEEQLQTALVDAAGRAESGSLARLLASMSASVTQHLLVLPTDVAP